MLNENSKPEFILTMLASTLTFKYHITLVVACSFTFFKSKFVRNSPSEKNKKFTITKGAQKTCVNGFLPQIVNIQSFHKPKWSNEKTDNVTNKIIT